MKKRFAAIPVGAARTRELGAFAQVYIALSGHADKEGRAFPSVATLAEETGLHRRTVQRALVKLGQVGLIRTEARLDDAGDSDTNLYTVLPDISEEGAADLPPPHGERSATGAAYVTATGAAQRATHNRPLNTPLNTGRARARDGIAPGAPADNRRARIEACLRHGCEWQPHWGEPPPGVRAAGAMAA